jgi:hypothetical protein
VSMCKNKIKWAPQFSKVHQDHSLPFAHVHLSQVCVFFSPPPWFNIIFQWPFWRVSVWPWEACLVLTTSHL